MVDHSQICECPQHDASNCDLLGPLSTARIQHSYMSAWCMHINNFYEYLVCNWQVTKPIDNIQYFPPTLSLCRVPEAVETTTLMPPLPCGRA